MTGRSDDGRAFFDTNVLVYRHDSRGPRKREIANRLFREYFRGRRGFISTQVLQEFFVAAAHKTRLLPVSEVALLLADYATLDNIVVIEPGHILVAAEAASRLRISFWDALIVAAARSAGAGVLFSEDLPHGRRYDGVLVSNPFLESLKGEDPSGGLRPRGERD
ncbi:MAG: PIN domain-containing protein [Bryobacteraceae bacterium]|nr:PIN domain-containing protein [Bryobacteraceae bacterium]